MVDLDPTRGSEQAGLRPAVIVSVDRFNHGPSNLVLVVPITSRDKGIPLHVRIDPPEGGLGMVSFAKPEDLRSVSVERLVKHRGTVAPTTLAEILDRITILIGT